VWTAWRQRGRIADFPPCAQQARRSGPFDGSATLGRMNPVHPKKLLLSKWTAVKPVGKDKHFLVARVIEPELPESKLEWIEIEALMSKKSRRIAWRELKDDTQWKQGWI
jgi:tryptophan-rich hypothetical protein